MDGPLADFDRQFWKLIDEWGIHTDIESRDQQTHRFADGHIVDSWDRKRVRRWIEQSNWFRHLPVTPGALDGVEALLSAGFDIWVCTKPMESNRTCRDDKARWLREHFPMLVDRLIIAPDKSRINGHVLLDDAPHLDWVKRASWWPVIFAMPFNGPGSQWSAFPHWTWADPIEALMERAKT